MSKLGDNTEILFRAGDTFDVKSSMNIYANNIVVGSYGSGRATIQSGDGFGLWGTRFGCGIQRVSQPMPSTVIRPDVLPQGGARLGQ